MNKKSLKLNAVLNVIKQLCVIAFPIITFPYASRVLGVTNYGKINFSSSIISYFTLLAALGITNYAIREGARIRNYKEKLNIFVNEIYSLNLISTIISYTLLFLSILFFDNLHSYFLLLIIQSLSIFFTTIGTDWINSIYEEYSFITIRYIICQTVSIIFMFIFVKDRNDYYVYAFSTVLSLIVANTWNIFHIKYKYGLNVKFQLNKGIRKHIKPVLILFASSIASLIYINSDMTILGVFKTDSDVGIYSVSVKIYSLIKQLINAVLIVAIPHISSLMLKKKKNELQEKLISLYTFLLLFTPSAIVGLFFLSEPLIRLFAGKEYISSNDSLQILAISLLFASFACFYINVVMIPFQQEKKILISTIFSALVNIVLNFILIPYYGVPAAAFTTLISEFLICMLGFFYTRKIFCYKSYRQLFFSVVGMLITAGSCLIIKNYSFSDWITIVLSMVISVLVYIMVLFVFDRRELKQIFLIIKKG